MSKPATNTPSNNDRLFTVAHSLLLTAVGARGVIPSGDEMRQIVREAREFMSELVTPTQRKTNPSPPVDESPAELYSQDDW